MELTSPFGNSSPSADLTLEPASGVEVVDGRTRAVALPFWVRFKSIAGMPPGRWIRLRYSSGFFNEAVRPLIRFSTAGSDVFIYPMNGAIFGSAEWVGRVPDGTIEVSISPGRRLGPFSFRVDGIEQVSRLSLLRQAWRNDPAWAYWAVRSWIIKSRQESWQALKYALGGTPFERYDEWQSQRSRPLDLNGFDRANADWTTAPVIQLLMSLNGGDVAALQKTLRSLRGQAYSRWTLRVLCGEKAPEDVGAAYRQEMQRDDRLSEMPREPHGNDLDADAWIAVIGAGDTLTDYALAVIVERLFSEPDLAVLYSDEDAVDKRGNVHSPLLKPDWSPTFFAENRYVGRLTCVRHAAAFASNVSREDLLLNENAALGAILARADRDAIGHVRRVLYRRLREQAPEIALSRVSMAAMADTAPPAWPRVSVVIPTRDRADLLDACTRGLDETTDYPSFDVVVVDNGSTDPDALALLDRLRANPRYRVLERPGPFNYSELSNDGARLSDAPMLVFLNNDVRMIDAGWLKALVSHAVRPEIGIVGAKLLFPNGKIQHAGVVLGMGGIAGHIYRRCAADEPGYLQQAKAPREMTAVTAACIALQRDKFEAVGGFDAENFAIDLNDMDLCLKVAERGWTNLWTPESVLIHVQSASRGIDRDPFQQYRRERGYFLKRWAEAIRDDPYFHPGFALYSQNSRLG